MLPSLIVIAALGSYSAANIDASTEIRADEQMLRTANVGTDGPGLLSFLRKQIELASHPDRINVLIRELGDDEFAVRERASEGLVSLGRAAVPMLKQAITEQQGKDPEVVHRARECIERIELGSTPSLTGAAVRLLAVRRPPGAAEVLLAYIPAAENEMIVDDIRNALTELAAKDNAVAGQLKTALRDSQPLRRAIAAEALSRARVTDARDGALALLKDQDPKVRGRVALVLARLNEKDAIPVLIELLPTMPLKQLLAVEDFLSMAAGENAPAVPLGTNDSERKKNRDAWSAWWKAHGAQLDLAKVIEANKPLGYTLVVLLDDNTVRDLDADNKPRWQVKDLKMPLDVQLLPNDRILVAEQGENQVTERNHKGEILWKKEINSPLVAQRLPNGNTFIANKMVLTEVDRDGKELYTHAMPGGNDIMRAAKLTNGDIACVSVGNRFFRLDEKGHILTGFQVNVATSGGRIDVLRNGNVLIPEKELDRVVEYSPNGKALWDVKVSQPIAAVRLPNGHTLVTSMDEKRAVEFDRQGKQIWEYRHETKVTRAFRR